MDSCGAVESPEARPAAVAIDFTDGDTSPSRARIPRRIRRRLLRGKSSGGRLSVEEIEAKLRDAELRRQVVYKRKFVSSVVFRLLGCRFEVEFREN
ncbi:hypothetical protein BHE74_00007056 [Ensete ventricosum]|nr:hypothetical protein BHE74_00007056 [Ensete ventricosum]